MLMKIKEKNEIMNSELWIMNHEHFCYVRGFSMTQWSDGPMNQWLDGPISK